MTAPPQKKPIIDLKATSDNNDTLSVKDSLMNTANNPMITPNSINPGTGSGAKRVIATEQDPFQMSESASIVPGSDKGSGVNLLSSHLGSSFNNANNNNNMNLSNLIWQLPYAERKSVLQMQ